MVSHLLLRLILRDWLSQCPHDQCARRAIVKTKQRWSAFGWVTKNYLELLRASEGTFSFRLYLQSLATNPHWARVVGYGSFSLCVIHKEDLCLSSGDIDMMMMMIETLTGISIVLLIKT
jgi:hypothetical protein